MSNRLSEPDLSWDHNGAPFSRHFDDIYFAGDNGPAESAFTFVEGNRLPERWGKQRRFVIAETGFGTGLNFLQTLACWRANRGSNQILHFVSVEAYPLCRQDLERAHGAWPELAQSCRQLQVRYPIRTAGFHRMAFPNGVILTLLFGEVGSVLPQLEASVDAWYLDGFAPVKNKAMWREEVFREMARLSAPAATVATFTAAGFVRRGLESVGFAMRKEAGFGAKRERLLGQFDPVAHPLGAGKAGRREWPLWAQSRSVSYGDRVGILGGGVAGTFLRESFRRRGIEAVVVAGKNGASANPAANVMPRLSADHSKPARVFWSAYRYALSQWRAIGALRSQGCLQLPTNFEQAERFAAIARNWGEGETDLRWLNVEQAGQAAGIDLEQAGLWFADAGLVCAEDWSATATADYLADVSEITWTKGRWQFAPTTPTFDAVVLAPGAQAPRLAQFDDLPLGAFGGQLSALSASSNSRQLRSTLICGHYLTPAVGDHHYLGATFDRVELDAAIGEPLAEDDARNLQALSSGFPAALRSLEVVGKQAWRGLRLATPDRLPLVGGLPEYQPFVDQFGWLRGNDRAPLTSSPFDRPMPFCLGALGSRGFTTAPLLAELVVSQMLGDPWPLERELAVLLHPARFWVRDLKRRLR